MAVDATKFQDLPIYFHILWASPINIMVSLYFLWRELGPATIAGLVLLLCLLPFNAVIGSKVKALQVIAANFHYIVFEYHIYVMWTKVLKVPQTYKS